MKKLIPVLVLGFVVSVIGCKTNPDKVVINVPRSSQPQEAEPPLLGEKAKKVMDNQEPKIIIVEETYNPDQEDGYIHYSSDTYNYSPILTITPTKDGLLIEKNHDPLWVHNTIHVISEATGLENPRVDNLGNNENTILYPFVKYGERYRVYIEKQEEGWTEWGTSKEVGVTAKGGIGNFNISYSKYLYDVDEKSLTFKDLTFTRPKQISANDVRWQGGPIFLGALWSSPNTYALTYEQDKSKLFIKLNEDNESFLDNLEKLGMIANQEVYYYDSVSNKYLKYIIPVLAEVVYMKPLKTTVLSGGETIPSVYITSSNGWYAEKTYHFGDSWKEADFELLDKDGNTLITDTITIKDRGNSTKWTDKTPFSIKLSSKKEVLGMKKHKRWVLMANYFDRSLIRTQFAGYLGNHVFNYYWNAKFTPVNVYINGNYYGTYDLGECNKIAKQRVNVQSIEDYVNNDSSFEDVNGDGKVDIEDAGFMVEIDTATNWGSAIDASNYKTKVATDNNGAERIYFYSSEKCIPMTLKDPDFGDKTEYSDEVCQEVGKYAKSKIDAFEKMLYSNKFEKYFTSYIDAVSFIDWYLINEFAKNSDANFQKSVPVTYNPVTGKLYMGPNWDFDLGFGNFNHGYQSEFGNSTVENTDGWYIWGGRKDCKENALYCEVNDCTTVQTWWINRLMESRVFKKAIKARWNDRKMFLKNAINQKIVEYANRIYDEIPANEEHLPRLGKESWNGPSGYAQRPDYEDEISYLYNWCIERYNWMDKEINKW